MSKLSFDVEDESVDRFEGIASSTPSPEQLATEQQQAELLLAVLKDLSERRRQIFLLHKFHHWTYEQIARHCGISRSAVEKNIHVVLTQLMAVKERLSARQQTSNRDKPLPGCKAVSSFRIKPWLKSLPNLTATTLASY